MLVPSRTRAAQFWSEFLRTLINGCHMSQKSGHKSETNTWNASSTSELSLTLHCERDKLVLADENAPPVDACREETQSVFS